jgi:hypothetical protein
VKDLERRFAGFGPDWSASKVRRPQFRILFFALFLARALTGDHAAGQLTLSDKTDSVHGTVINSVTRAPISRALVSSPDNRFATMTDDEGHFEFTFPAPAAGQDDQASVNPNRPVALSARKPGFVRDSSQARLVSGVTIESYGR